MTEGDFHERESDALKQWNAVSQSLQRLNLEVDTLQATVNGLRRMLREAPQAGVVRDPATVVRFERELAQTELEVASHRQQVDGLRKLVGAGRVQVGFGDQRFVEDDQARRAYREALDNEVRLAASGAAGSEACHATRGGSHRSSGPPRPPKEASSVHGEIEHEVARKTQIATAEVARENSALVANAMQLDKLDSEARLRRGRSCHAKLRARAGPA